jgi:hypothetical protein
MFFGLRHDCKQGIALEWLQQKQSQWQLSTAVAVVSSSKSEARVMLESGLQFRQERHIRVHNFTVLVLILVSCGSSSAPAMICSQRYQ